ncbi:hypothetical protein COB57_04080 [Candidatus Peregrinibacteria bacterium]|nr:MAG: hypothetical protein COB57_04080 [Candidatus Peregrinibacteria bacterium]
MKFQNIFLTLIILSFLIFIGYILSNNTMSQYVFSDITNQEIAKKEAQDFINIHKPRLLEETQGALIFDYNKNRDADILKSLQQIIHEYQQDTKMLQWIYEQYSYLLTPRGGHGLFNMHLVKVPIIFQQDTDFLLTFLKNTPELFPHIKYSLRNDPQFVKTYYENLQPEQKTLDFINTIIYSIGAEAITEISLQKKIFRDSDQIYPFFSHAEKIKIENFISAISRSSDNFNYLPLPERNEESYIRLFVQETSQDNFYLSSYYEDIENPKIIALWEGIIEEEKLKNRAEDYETNE